MPEKINIDKSGANLSVLKEYNCGNKTDIENRQVKYINNTVEQDHRAIKRITRGMLGFKSFNSTSITLSGIEIVRMIRKSQIETKDKSVHRTANIFDSLAA